MTDTVTIEVSVADAKRLKEFAADPWCIVESFTEHLHTRAHAAEPWRGGLPPGKVLRAAREQVGESQERIANTIGCSRLTYHRYENGQVSNPRALNTRWARKVITALFDEVADEKGSVGNIWEHDAR